MSIEHVVLSGSLMLLIALLAEPLARRLHLPFAALLVIIGYLGSELVVYLGHDTGIRAGSFGDLIFFVFLPILVFESAYRIEQDLLWANLFPILVLAIFVMLLSAGLTAIGLFFGIGHPTGFPWVAALLTGVLLAATDPVAVVAQLKSLGAPKRLGILLEGESLFNDATAIVVFSVALGVAMAPGAAVSPGGAMLEFLKVFLGGASVGALAGLAAGQLMQAFRAPVAQGVISLVTAYGTFLLAEYLLHVSGVMAALATGLLLRRAVDRQATKYTSTALEYLWELVGYIANALVFLLVGVVITLPMFQERWLAMLIAIAAVLLARALSIYTTVPLISLFMKDRISVSYQTVIVWGGLRGAVTLALALSLPTELDYWWTIQSIAFGVVLFALFVQAPSTKLMLTRFGLSS